ncbi:MAG: hypothetical protein QM813_12755 [Verrucomicrobiota bacterium]
MQSELMKTDQAHDTLITIRTLMERSALYRRALAPIMTFAGTIGIIAAIAGIWLRVEAETTFIGYWLGIALVGLAGALVLVRRQALKSAEPFWSPPTRRVAIALLPCLTAGLFLSLWFLTISLAPIAGDPPAGMTYDRSTLICLVALWAILYGCALHAAGFYTTDGIRLLGWLFLTGGVAILFGMLIGQRQDFPVGSWRTLHWLMGALFGLLQLAYGIYLFFTEPNENAA